MTLFLRFYFGFNIAIYFLFTKICLRKSFLVKKLRKKRSLKCDLILSYVKEYAQKTQNGPYFQTSFLKRCIELSIFEL